jgi:hypothetical protein
LATPDVSEKAAATEENIGQPEVKPETDTSGILNFKEAILVLRRGYYLLTTGLKATGLERVCIVWKGILLLWSILLKH